MKIDWKGIAEGIKNNLAPDEDIKGLIKQIATERMAICDACENKKSTLAGAFCGICGCNLRLKTKALSAQCPIDKWLAVTDKETAEYIKANIK